MPDMTPADVAEWNAVTASIVQALLGTITPNMRAVALSKLSSEWLVTFVLADLTEFDDEAIEDALTDFEAMNGRELRFDYKTVVTTERIELPQPPARLVFLRRGET